MLECATQNEIIQDLQEAVQTLTPFVDASFRWAETVDDYEGCINTLVDLLNNPDYLLWHSFQVWNSYRMNEDATAILADQFSSTIAPYLQHYQQQIQQSPQSQFDPRLIAERAIQQPVSKEPEYFLNPQTGRYEEVTPQHSQSQPQHNYQMQQAPQIPMPVPASGGSQSDLRGVFAMVEAMRQGANDPNLGKRLQQMRVQGVI